MTATEVKTFVNVIATVTSSTMTIAVCCRNTVSASAGSLATLEELGAIFRHIDTLTEKMAQSLYEGDVAALPLKGKKYDGCAYCVYKAVCLREEDDPSREAEDRSPEEVMEELKGKEDHDEA